MPDPLPPWAAAAWQHWHRPWAVTHASWLAGQYHGQAGDSRELTLRLHYAAWCEQHALEPVLSGFGDTPWWLLLGLRREPFEQVARRVGLTLSYASDRRLRLLRGTAQDVSEVRWALGRAQALPEAAVAAACAPAPQRAPEALAASSLLSCLQEAPLLWPRMRLRFPRESVPSEGPLPNVHRTDAAARSRLASLWRAAARAQEAGLA